MRVDFYKKILGWENVSLDSFSVIKSSHCSCSKTIYEILERYTKHLKAFAASMNWEYYYE